MTMTKPQLIDALVAREIYPNKTTARKESVETLRAQYEELMQVRQQAKDVMRSSNYAADFSKEREAVKVPDLISPKPRESHSTRAPRDESPQARAARRNRKAKNKRAKASRRKNRR